MQQQLSLLAPVSKPPPPETDIMLRLEFDQRFRPSYPKRRNNEWATASDAYLRARRSASMEEILAGLARYQFSDDPQFRPMAATWLNQKRWLSVAEDFAADPWGLGDWLASQSNRDSNGMGLDCLAPEAVYPVFVAAGWPETWRGSLEALQAWVRDGFDIESVAAVIRDLVAASGPRKGLEAFDRKVRLAARTTL